MQRPGKIPTQGGAPLAHHPFGALGAAGWRPAPAPAAAPLAPAPAPAPTPVKQRGRVELKRTTAGRGGKTVTLATGFVGIGLPEKEALCKKLRAACGCGGTVKDGAIEIQGDQRETMARLLTAAGFRPVFAGG